MSDLPVGLVGGEPGHVGWHNTLHGRARRWSDAVQYVSPTRGDNAKDGLFKGTAKATVSAALAELAGAPGVVYIAPGTVIDQGIVLRVGQHLVSAGPGPAIIQLANGANTFLLETLDFAALTGTNAAAGPYNFGLHGIVLDGNKANQTAGTEALVRIYGFGYVVEHVRIRNARNRGFHSEWSTEVTDPGGDSMEAVVHDLRVHKSGGDGFNWNGPHDSLISGMIIYLNGGVGIYTGPASGGTMFVNCHSWGLDQTWAWDLQGYATRCTSCVAEGALNGQVRILENDIHWDGGLIAPAHATLAGQTGLVIGSASKAVAGTRVDTEFQHCNPAVSLVNDAGGVYRAKVYQTTGNVLTGTLHATSDLSLSGGGGAAGVPRHVQRGGMELSGNLQLLDGEMRLGTAGDTRWYRNGPDQMRTDDELIAAGNFTHLGTGLGFFGTGGWSKGTVTGSRGGNAALESLLIHLHNYGLITNNTTA